MEFSVIQISSSVSSQRQAIVDAGDGRLGYICLGNKMLVLHYWRDNDAGAKEWELKTIPLPDADRLSYTFTGTGAGYLLLQAVQRYPTKLAISSQGPGVPKVQFFTLEVKTLLLERLCMSNRPIGYAHLYANFPLLSLPTV
jgi:hypothetical protein